MTALEALLAAPSGASLDALLVAWWRWLAPLAVQLLLLGAPLWLLDRLWARSGRRGLRALLWSAVLLRVLWPAELGLAVLPGALPGLPLDATPLRDALSDVDAEARPPSAPSGTGATSLLPGRAALRVLGGAWLGGVLLGAWLHRRRLRAARRARGAGAAPRDPRLRAELAAAAARLGLRRPPRVRVHTALGGPLVDGLRRPTLHLPADFLRSGDERARAHVLLHELAHLRRGDTRRAALASAVTRLLWFHPVARLAVRRLYALREQAADDLAARHAAGGRPAYRRSLLEAAARALLPERASPGLALLGARAPLLERLARLDAPPPRAQPAALPALALATAALLPLRAAAPVDASPGAQRAAHEASAHHAIAQRTASPGAAPAPLSASGWAAPLERDTPLPPGAAAGCFRTRHALLSTLVAAGDGPSPPPSAPRLADAPPEIPR